MVSVQKYFSLRIFSLNKLKLILIITLLNIFFGVSKEFVRQGCLKFLFAEYTIASMS